MVPVIAVFLSGLTLITGLSWYIISILVSLEHRLTSIETKLEFIPVRPRASKR